MTNKKPSIKNILLVDPAKDNSKRCPMSGSKSDDFANVLARQAVDSLWVKDSSEVQIDQQMQAALVGLMGAAPQDEIEGMAATQMLAAHNATMECFKRAMIPEQSVNSRDYNLNHAGKLMRAYSGMMEALNRYRGKGQQKMTVEHVHVHAGGQAIVGNVTHPEGGGVQKKTEEQPHAITHAPEQAMPRPNKNKQPVPVPRDG